QPGGRDRAAGGDHRRLRPRRGGGSASAGRLAAAAAQARRRLRRHRSRCRPQPPAGPPGTRRVADRAAVRGPGRGRPARARRHRHRTAQHAGRGGALSRPRGAGRHQRGAPMTYCVAARLDAGIVFASDTRTNAGIDDIANAEKMRAYVRRGERVVVTMRAGNMSVTQGALAWLDERAEAEPGAPTLWNVPNMAAAARLVGVSLRAVDAVGGQAMTSV